MLARKGSTRVSRRVSKIYRNVPILHQPLIEAHSTTRQRNRWFTYHDDIIRGMSRLIRILFAAVLFTNCVVAQSATPNNVQFNLFAADSAGHTVLDLKLQELNVSYGDKNVHPSVGSGMVMVAISPEQLMAPNRVRVRQ